MLKRRPYPNYEQTNFELVPQVPKGWSVMPLKRVARITYGIGEPPSYVEEGIPLIRATNVSAGKVSEIGLVKVNPTDIPASRIVWLKAGDIIVVRSGAYTGDSAIITEDWAGSIAGFDMVVKPIAVNPKLLAYELLSHFMKEGQIYLEKMRAAQPHLNAEELGTCLCILPPDEEQTHLVEFLDTETAKIDALISEQQDLISLLREKRQAVISHAVTKGLNPDVLMKDSGTDWLGEVPEHWVCCRAKQIFMEVDERSADGMEELLTVSHITGVTPRSEKNVNMFMAETLEGYKVCRVSDFVINTMWAWMGAMGVTSYHGIVSPSYNVYRQRVSSLDPRYFDYLCRTPDFTVIVKSRSTGVWESRLRLYPDEFFSIILPVPPLSEQRVIVDMLDSETYQIEELISEAESCIALMQEHRTALISAVVTGKVDVREHVMEAV
jgi:type I restriction enzyme S subunit